MTDEKFDPEDYLGEADKHWTRYQQLSRTKRQLDDVDPFDRQRRPMDGHDELGVAKAHEALFESQYHSRTLWERAIAAHIADDIGYTNKIQSRKPNDEMEIVMWEPATDDTIRDAIEAHSHAIVVDEFENSGDTVYTLKIDFEGYYDGI